MTFFNKKEDVMKIELTPYGRHLLMKGQLKPHYYAFFDDDILYDARCAGVTENTTDAKTRILVDTPSLKPPTTLTSVESRYFNQITREDDNVLLNPIGTNKPVSKNANGWEATAIVGEFSSSLGYISSSTSPIQNIPQIECEMNFTMSVTQMNKDDYFSYDYLSSEIAEDDTFLKLKYKPLILHLTEKNGFSYKDSLAIGVYKYEQGSDTVFNKIHFQDKNPDHPINAVDPDDYSGLILNNEGDTTIIDDADSVGNYFFVLKDQEIPNEDLCRGLRKLKEKNIYLGLDIDCEDFFFDEVNIYETLVTDADIEDCEK